MLLLKVFGGQKIFISTTSDTHINPFDLSLNYGCSDTGKSEPVKSKVEYIIAFLESIVGANALTGGQKTIIDRCTKIIFEDYEKSNFEDESLLPTLPDFYNMLLKQLIQKSQNTTTIMCIMPLKQMPIQKFSISFSRMDLVQTV